ncbi:MAG: leucine-rich repeat domain-containing protein [Clostridia bacterium]|nr:leucine-rich repeat domain-containing protein [Clostridia bacterium]
MMPGFVFPKTLPEEIEKVSRIDGVAFVMAYYEAVIGTIVERLTALIASKGLEFTLNADRTSYTVSRGSCTDAHVVIPKFHQDKPVTTIKQMAFYKCSFLTKVTIPDSVVRIDYSAFRGCTSLTSVTIPKSIFHPGPQSAFLTEQNLPHSIGDHSFAGCSSLTDIRYEGTIDQWATTIDSINSAFSGVPAKFVECADGRSNDLSSFGDRIASAFAIPRKK